ncbi:hypothetical protein HYT25_04200 [Candidatus Pacearchaeota archaeon]|nr:hypothetical protein [Candidatus Pacearchaeota archaeon]
MVRGKFILSGTGNDGFRHKYHINKDKGFREIFISFMTKLEFDQKEIQGIFNQGYESEIEDDEQIYAQWKIDADEIVDETLHFENEKYEVDVFFGSKKVFLVVRTKNRNEMIDLLRKDVSWKSDEEFEKIREENKEKRKQRALKEIEKQNKSNLIKVEHEK